MNGPSEKARPLPQEKRAESLNNSKFTVIPPEGKDGLGNCAKCNKRVHGRNFGGILSTQTGTVVWCSTCVTETGAPRLTLAEVWP
jgi:hypothetical protein